MPDNKLESALRFVNSLKELLGSEELLDEVLDLLQQDPTLHYGVKGYFVDQENNKLQVVIGIARYCQARDISEDTVIAAPLDISFRFIREIIQFVKEYHLVDTEDEFLENLWQTLGSDPVQVLRLALYLCLNLLGGFPCTEEVKSEIFSLMLEIAKEITQIIQEEVVLGSDILPGQEFSGIFKE